MLLQSLFVAAVLPVLGAAPRGEDKPSKPKSPPPGRGFAFMELTGIVKITRTEPRFVLETRKQIVQMNGVQQVTTVTVQRQVFVTVAQCVEAKALQVFDKDGAKVDIKELPKLFEKTVPVLISPDGKKVHTSYTKGAKGGTLVLILPTPEVIPPPKPSAGGSAPKDGARP